MNAIVSVTEDWGIGYKGKLLVPNSADMRRFRELTSGGTVIMGRKTLESFPAGPLKGRRNICLTRNASYAPKGVEVVSSAQEALAAVVAEDPDTVWLIGGETVYRLMLDACECAYVTMNRTCVEADAYFPNLDAMDGWRLESTEPGGTTADGVEFEYRLYARA